MQEVPQDISALVAENTALKAQLAEYGELVARLNDWISELERLKGQNNRNSGKPPPSDGLAGRCRATDRTVWC